MNRNCIKSVSARPYANDLTRTEWRFELVEEAYLLMLAAMSAEVDRLFKEFEESGIGHCPSQGEYWPGENWCWVYIAPKQGVDFEIPVNLTDGHFSIILNNNRPAGEELNYTIDPALPEPDQWMRAASAFKETIQQLNINL